MTRASEDQQQKFTVNKNTGIALGVVLLLFTVTVPVAMTLATDRADVKSSIERIVENLNALNGRVTLVEQHWSDIAVKGELPRAIAQRLEAIEQRNVRIEEKLDALLARVATPTPPQSWLEYSANKHQQLRSQAAEVD